MITIKEITATDTYAVRQPVLRSGKPIENCHFPGDDLPTTKHFGLQTDQLIGVISLFENRPLKYVLINGGYMIVSFTVMGAILGGWK